eukprot:jgi/Tetstr1/461611/TSEL_006711.t1
MARAGAVREVFRFLEHCQEAECSGRGLTAGEVHDGLRRLLSSELDKRSLAAILGRLTEGRRPDSKLKTRELVHCLEDWLASMEHKAEAARGGQLEDVPAHVAAALPPGPPPSAPRATHAGRPPTGGRKKPAPGPAPSTPGATPRPVLRERCRELEEELDVTKAAVLSLLEHVPGSPLLSPGGVEQLRAHSSHAAPAPGHAEGRRSEGGGEAQRQGQGRRTAEPGGSAPAGCAQGQHAPAASSGGAPPRPRPLPPPSPRHFDRSLREVEQLEQSVAGGIEGVMLAEQHALMNQIRVLKEQVQLGAQENHSLLLLLEEERRNSIREAEAAAKATQAKSSLEQRFQARGDVMQQLNDTFKIIHDKFQHTLRGVELSHQGAAAARSSLGGQARGVAEAHALLAGLAGSVGALEGEVAALAGALEAQAAARRTAEGAAGRLGQGERGAAPGERQPAAPPRARRLAVRGERGRAPEQPPPHARHRAVDRRRAGPAASAAGSLTTLQHRQARPPSSKRGRLADATPALPMYTPDAGRALPPHPSSPPWPMRLCRPCNPDAAVPAL